MNKNTLDELLRLPRPRHEAELPLDRIALNPYQPRDPIGEEDIEGMKSYLQSSVLQPIIVHEKGDRFELVAGERRLRAAKALGRVTIPAMVYPELTPGQSKLMSLQENLGRKDLNWLEIARGYQALHEEGLTHEQIAGLVGVSKATVTNRIGLLSLPEEVKKVGRPTFSEGHATALLGLGSSESQLEAFRLWEKSPVNRKSFRKVVKGVKDGLIAGGEAPEETTWATKSVPDGRSRHPVPEGRSWEKTWKITKNFLLSLTRSPDTGFWRLTLEARPAVMVGMAVTFAAVLVLIFGARLAFDLLSSKDGQITESRPTGPTKPIGRSRQASPEKAPTGLYKGEKKAILAEKEEASSQKPAEKKPAPAVKKPLPPVKKKAPAVKKKPSAAKKPIPAVKKPPPPVKKKKKKPAAKKKPSAAKKAAPAVKTAVKKPRSKPKTKYGLVTTDAIPWSYCWVDGVKQEKTTPISDLRLPAGKHRFKYNNPYLGITKEVELDVIQGKKVNILIYLRKDEDDVKIEYSGIEKKP